MQIGQKVIFSKSVDRAHVPYVMMGTTGVINKADSEGVYVLPDDVFKRAEFKEWDGLIAVYTEEINSTLQAVE